ncbi:MAG: FKBP-type peptidyl-prolyl cis-trans isomerase [Desulfobacca sp.]|nr:FKBP-type peptidyl-prolyl cis-trans isomerase [Desulfobacca sp.]
MKVGQNSFVNLEYQLRIDNDTIYPPDGEPEEISICMGRGGMPLGLESALMDMEEDEIKVINLNPQQAFGEIKDQLIYEVSREEFDPAVELRPGLIFEATNEQGKPSKFYIRELKPETVVIDFNHPLAGKELEVVINIRQVREATKEDLARLYGPRAAEKWETSN